MENDLSKQQSQNLQKPEIKGEVNKDKNKARGFVIPENDEDEGSSCCAISDDSRFFPSGGKK